MQKCPSRPTSLVDNFLGQYLEVIAVICLWITDNIDQSCPAAADADDFIAFPRSPNRNGADRRVKAWDIASRCENTNDPWFFCVHTRHQAALLQCFNPPYCTTFQAKVKCLMSTSHMM